MKQKEKHSTIQSELEGNQVPPKDIFSYNEMRSCSELFNLYKEKTLDIQPEFQRNDIWPLTMQTRFIDSLIKELPIPNLCFSYDKAHSKMNVIDGLQRIATVIKFLGDKEWRMSSLPDIDSRISGKTNSYIKEKYPEIYNNIRHLSLPVTFLRVEHSNSEHDEYIYRIFHRLNTYGQKLNNQEIRNCIFSGPFNSMLKELNDKNKNWKNMLAFKVDKRFVKTELLLRFFALYDNHEQYEGKLNEFLNEYMSKHRNASSEEIEKKKNLFETVVKLADESLNNTASIGRMSNAVVDAFLFGIAKNINRLEMKDPSTILEGYHQLRDEEVFDENHLSEGVMKKEKVISRLNKSLDIFAGK